MKWFSVLVTGANKGLGFQLVKQLMKLPTPVAPEHVFAGYLKTETLQGLNAISETSTAKPILHRIELDVSKRSDLDAAKKTIENVVGERGLTLLVNNAAVMFPQPFVQITEENMHMQYAVNTVGPVIATQTMLPLLKKAANFTKDQGMSFSRAGVLTISSREGSIKRVDTDVAALYVFGYKISKAALNMAMRIVAHEVKEEKILVVNVCPGWMNTDMGGVNGDKTAEESAAEILEVSSRLNETNHGSYMNSNGIVLPF